MAQKGLSAVRGAQRASGVARTRAFVLRGGQRPFCVSRSSFPDSDEDAGSLSWYFIWLEK